MPVINAKNILHVSSAVNRTVWNDLRQYAGVTVHVRDFFPSIPLIGGWGASAHGVIAVLVGDDPGTGTTP